MPASSSGNDPRVDDLRQRLRALGYLDAGVDRFVLGSARQTRRPATLALLASVRVGALAALVLGPAAALGLSGTRARTDHRNARRIRRRPLSRRLLRRIDGRGLAHRQPPRLLVRRTIDRSIRHTRTTRGTGGRRAGHRPVRRLSHAVVADGHRRPGLVFAAVDAFRTDACRCDEPPPGACRHCRHERSRALGDRRYGRCCRRGGRQDRRLERRSPAQRSSLAWRHCSSPGRRVRSAGRLAAVQAITVVPSGLRVRVIAIDGFDSRVFETLAASGRVPALRAALGGATMQLQSRPGDAGDPARVWTTVATGQPPEVHAVQGLETRRLAGVQGSVAITEPSPLGRAIRGATDLVRLTRPAIASGSERRAKTFWEVAAEAGLRTVVVNWWATWPAPQRAGVVLSDRAVLRLERGGALDAEIAPGEIYESLREKWSAITSRAREQVSESIASSTEDSTRAVLLRSAELDAIQLALLQSVVTPQTDLAVVYLPGLDIAQHALLGQRGPGTTPRTRRHRRYRCGSRLSIVTTLPWTNCSRRCCNRPRMKSSSSSPSLDALAATRPRVCR